MKSEKEVIERINESNNKLVSIGEVFEGSPLKEQFASNPKISTLMGEIDALSWVLEKEESEEMNKIRKKLEKDWTNLTRKQDWIK